MNCLNGITVEKFAQLKSENILLSELHGSEKQIAWASKIRDGYMALLDQYILQRSTRIIGMQEQGQAKAAQDLLDESIHVARKIICGISRRSSAKNWILARGDLSMISAQYSDDCDTFDASKGWEQFYQS